MRQQEFHFVSDFHSTDLQDNEGSSTDAARKLNVISNTFEGSEEGNVATSNSVQFFTVTALNRVGYKQHHTFPF